jgi:hypothetical protein
MAWPNFYSFIAQQCSVPFPRLMPLFIARASLGYGRLDLDTVTTWLRSIVRMWMTMHNFFPLPHDELVVVASIMHVAAVVAPHGYSAPVVSGEVVIF